MIPGNVSRDVGNDECHREIWHFTLSTELVIHFHKYQLIRHCAVNLADFKTLQLWQYPDLANKSTIPQPDVAPWAIQDAKTLILSKIKIA